jgi:hypothetical protein
MVSLLDEKGSKDRSLNINGWAAGSTEEPIHVRTKNPHPGHFGPTLGPHGVIPSRAITG